MKKIALIAALALCMPAHAQEARQPAAAAQKPPRLVQATPKHKPAHHKLNPRRQEDARHCLNLGSNTEIIKCAEAYL